MENFALNDLENVTHLNSQRNESLDKSGHLSPKEQIKNVLIQQRPKVEQNLNQEVEEQKVEKISSSITPLNNLSGMLKEFPEEGYSYQKLINGEEAKYFELNLQSKETQSCWDLNRREAISNLIADINKSGKEDPTCQKPKNIRNLLKGYEILQELGKGGFGLVLKLKNKSGEIKAVKLFFKESDPKKAKKNEKTFLNEFCIASSMALQYHTPRLFQDSKFLESKEYFGFIMDAGIGTLKHFKDFLLDSSLRLTENELLDLFAALWTNYTIFRKLNLCHRDLKPSNVILYADGLNVEIIDYSLAVCTKPVESRLKVSGTMGYIDPKLYQKEGNFSAENLVEADFYSLGVVLLEMAVPDYTPKEFELNSEKNRRIVTLEGMAKVQELIRILLFEQLEESRFQLVKKCAEKLKIPQRSKEVKFGFCSGLEKYQGRFIEYLNNSNNNFSNEKTGLDQADEKKYEEINYDRSEAEIIEDDKRDIYTFLSGEKSDSYLLYQLKFKEITQLKNELFCHEHNLKSCLMTNYLGKEAEDSCKKIESILEMYPYSSALTFSTLGIYNFCIQNYGKAKQSFFQGLQKAENMRTKLILLNNYGCVLLNSNSSEMEYYDSFSQACSLLKEEILDTSDYIIKAWDNFEGKCKEFTSLPIYPINPIKSGHKFNMLESRAKLFDFVLQPYGLYDESSFDEADPIKQLFQIVFFNFCYAQAKYLEKSLKVENIYEKFLPKVQDFLEQYKKNKENHKPTYENLAINFHRFAKIFANEITLEIKNSELQKFLSLSTRFYNKTKKQSLVSTLSYNPKKYLEQYFFSLLSSMIGFVFLFSLPSNTVQIIKEETSQDIKNQVLIKTFIPDCLVPFIGLCEYGVEFIDHKQRLWKLRDLKLELHRSKGNIFAKLIAYLGNFIELDSFSLNLKDFESNVNKNFFYVFQEGLLRLEKLEDLRLTFQSTAEFMDEDLKCISSALSHLKRLENFSMNCWMSYITNEGLKLLTDALGGLENLNQVYLSLHYCPNITDKAISFFASTLSRHSKLRTLLLVIGSCRKVRINRIKKLNKELSKLYEEKNIKISLSSWKVPLML